jgi:hypothetical protein
MVRWHTPETSLPQVSRKLLMRKTFVTIGQGKCERIASWQRRRRWQRRGCRRWLVCWRRIYHRAEHAQHCGLLELERKEDTAAAPSSCPSPLARTSCRFVFSASVQLDGEPPTGGWHAEEEDGHGMSRSATKKDVGPHAVAVTQASGVHGLVQRYGYVGLDDL